MTVSGHHALSEETSSGSAQPETGLCFSDLRAGYGDAADILSGLRLQLDPGAFTVLLGASGSGKTTLIKSAVGLVQPRSGCIELGGKSLLGRKSGATRRRISMIHQDFGLAPRLSVIQNVMAGVSAETSFLRVLFQAYPRSVQARAVEMLLSVGLQPEQFDRRARELSGGQMQRVGIARALMRDPSFLLADEPIASLDPMTSEKVMSLLQEIGRTRRIGILCSLHQIDMARRFADRIVGMKSGKIVFDGSPDELTPDALDEIFGRRPGPVRAKALVPVGAS